MSSKNEKRIARLIKWKRWNKIAKELEKADSQTRVEFAAEFGKLAEENCYNYLINLLDDKDEDVQLQAIKSLGDSGRENAKTHLQKLAENLPKEKNVLHDAIRESISKINKAVAQQK
jgi:HEAT repeat protein